MGLLGAIFKGVAILVLAVVGLSAYLWFTDYEAQATVTQKGSDAGGSYIILRPKLVPTDIRQDLDRQSWEFVCEGYGVTYRIQTERYQVRDTQGRLVYDSEEGLTDAFAPVRCATLGL